MTHRDRDQGVTLIELLVAISLMAVAFGAVFGGLGLMFKIQSDQRATSTIDLELRNYAERILDATYVACPSATQTSYSAVTKPTGLTATMAVEFFAGTYNSNNSGVADFQATCPTVDRGVQRITITLTDSRGVSGQLKFAKHDNTP